MGRPVSPLYPLAKAPEWVGPQPVDETDSSSLELILTGRSSIDSMPAACRASCSRSEVQWTRTPSELRTYKSFAIVARRDVFDSDFGSLAYPNVSSRTGHVRAEERLMQTSFHRWSEIAA